ncbi:hypothetical protein JCM17823_00450 [Halorubrum gandharaense]
MNDDRIDDLVDHLHETVGENLRSVITYNYDCREYDVVYAREGVLDAYHEQQIANIVRTYESDSLSKPGQEQWYAHGEQQCVLRCFEGGVELNLIGDGRGVAVGLDVGALAGQHSFVGTCLEIAGVD